MLNVWRRIRRMEEEVEVVVEVMMMIGMLYNKMVCCAVL